VPEGMTRFYASKPAALYPDTRLSVFADSSQPITRMRVKAGEVTAHVNITIGNLGGLLSGEVLDSVSGSAISARITVSLPDDANKMLSQGTEFKRPGAFNIVLASRPLKVEIKAAGYVPWAYTGPDEVSPGVIQIEPGETVKLIIQLVKQTR